MAKTVGKFNGKVAPPWPCWCEITDNHGGTIKFQHNDLADLMHLIKELQREVRFLLPERDQFQAEL